MDVITTQNMWEHLTASLSPSTNEDSRTKIRSLIKDALYEVPNPKIADFGGGPGVTACDIAQAIPDSTVFYIERSNAMVETAGKLFDGKNLKNVRVVHASYDTVFPRIHDLDFIINIQLRTNVEDPMGMQRILSKSLKKDGQYFEIMTNEKFGISMEKLFGKYARVCWESPFPYFESVGHDKAYIKQFFSPAAPYIFGALRIPGMKKILSEGGFQVVRHDPEFWLDATSFSALSKFFRQYDLFPDNFITGFEQATSPLIELQKNVPSEYRRRGPTSDGYLCRKIS